MSRLDSDQGSSTAALEAAANDLHRAGEAGLAARGSLYERLLQEIDRLRDHYAHIEIPAAAKPLGEGNEHLVFFIPESNRVFKRTRGSAYGVILDDVYEIDPTTQQYRGYLWFREALPSEYLSRLALTNRHFGDDVHFEGITFFAANNPSIITSQTFIKGDDPTVAEVQEFMRAAGFKSVRRELIRSDTVGRNTWYRAKDGLLVLDAKSANFKKGENGNLFPIDLPIRYLPDNQALNLRGSRR